MALVSPGTADVNLLPTGVVEAGVGPGWVVAGVELPWAIESDGAAAQPLNHQREGRRRGAAHYGYRQQCCQESGNSGRGDRSHRSVII